MRRTFYLLPIAAAVLTLAGLSAGPVPPGESADGPDELTLVYNVNNGGYIDVCGCKHKEVRQGSLTRRSSFLKQLRATGRDIVLLDGGSTLFEIDDRVKEAERDEAIRKARLIVEAYGHMGYDALAVGAYDLAAGLDSLIELSREADFPFLTANLARRESGELVFPPHTVIERAGVRVGVIGLTLETLSRVYLEKVAPGVELLDPLKAARRSVEELRDRTDMIVALSHLREGTNEEIVDTVGDIAAVVDPYIRYGNHRTWIKEHEWLGVRKGTLVLRSDGQGARMGVVDLRLRDRHPRLVSADRLEQLEYAVRTGDATAEEEAELARLREEAGNTFRFRRISLEPHHLTDPYVDGLVEAWKEGKPDAEALRALEAELEDRHRWQTHDTCRPCHEAQWKFWKGTAHAHAYESLKETGDHHRYDCVGCHTLGYGQAFLNTREIGAYADVQCESCHGNAPGHAEEPAEHAYGRVQRLRCITCHNKEQTKRTFDFHRSRRLVACPAMERPAGK